MPRFRTFASIVIAGGFAVGVACSVDSLDVANKRCPCTSGYVCDTSRDVCVLEGTLAVPDAGVPDADIGDSSGDFDAAGKVVVFNLKSTWQTPNGMRWDWQASGDFDQFDRYEVITGPHAEDVRARAPNTQRFDPTRNPELGAAYGRTGKPKTQPVLLWTVTDGEGHSPGTPVFAQVLAYDKAGGVSTSDIASDTPPVSKGAMPIFHDTMLAGGTPTSVTTLSGQNPYEGTKCLASTNACDASPDCGDVGAVNYTNTLPATVNNTNFDRAFLELAIRGKSTTAFADIILALGPPKCGTDCRVRFTSMSFRSDPNEWRVVQIPLGFFRQNDGTGPRLTFNVLNSAAMQNGRINGFLLSGTYPDGVEIALDEVRIRW